KSENFHVEVSSSGKMVAIGNRKDDFFFGHDGHDTIEGDGGKDQILSGGGNDVIFGYKGDDRLDGGSGDDHLEGGTGNDILIGGSGKDVVEGGKGDDTLKVIEENEDTANYTSYYIESQNELDENADDYDRWIGGEGDDSYVFNGNWRIASLSEENDGGDADVIDLSENDQDYVHVLSNGNLFASPGKLLENGSIELKLNDLPTPKVHLATSHADLTGLIPSTGQVVTEVGFGLHQANSGKTGKVLGDAAANAVITAVANLPNPSDLKGKLHFRLWVDRADGAPQVYNLNVNHDAKNYVNADAIVTDLQNQLTSSAVTFGVSQEGKLTITATPSGSLDQTGHVKPARLELTATDNNNFGTVVADSNSFSNFDEIELGSGEQHFLFGNEYWGTGSSNLATFGTLVGLPTFVTNKGKTSLTIDTTATTETTNPITLDFRAVNRELRFEFKKNDNDGVELTVKTVRNVKIPILNIGPDPFYSRQIKFTNLDEHTTIFGGRFKNTFDFTDSSFKSKKFLIFEHKNSHLKKQRQTRNKTLAI
ncbi:MAG: hypothetical protein MK106_16280, partial [Mariniblastus sp.]|nr:hypothetical protein [Mariniblastus sp.]